MSAQILAERVAKLTPSYEDNFSKRGGVTPTDPLKFHLYHLALFWSRLIGFCRQKPLNTAGWIDSDLGACVQIGSEFAHKVIGTESPIHGRWLDYWAQAHAVLHQRPVTIAAVESASQAFHERPADLRHDPCDDVPYPS